MNDANYITYRCCQDSTDDAEGIPHRLIRKTTKNKNEKS